jgi:hypothetical protein
VTEREHLDPQVGGGELAELNDFLAERFPLLKQEWHARI